jgi:hypothetical protein
MLSGLDFLTNLSLADLAKGVEVDLCPIRVKCMRKFSETKREYGLEPKCLLCKMQYAGAALRFQEQKNRCKYPKKIVCKNWVSDYGYLDVNLTNIFIATIKVMPRVSEARSAQTPRRREHFINFSLPTSPRDQIWEGRLPEPQSKSLPGMIRLPLA